MSDHPTAQDFISAYVAAVDPPSNADAAEIERFHGLRRRAALEGIQAIRDNAEELGLHMHRAFRPEVVSEVSVPLTEESDWDAIAKWCNGTIRSAPDGTDSGEWTSWIDLPNGEAAFPGTHISKGFDGTFQVRTEVEAPDVTTLLQAEAVGWQKGFTAALALDPRDTAAALAEGNPGKPFLPTPVADEGADDVERARGVHRLRLSLTEGEGVTTEVFCTHALHAPCRGGEECGFVEAFRWDIPAALESYRGPAVALLDMPVEVTSVDEYGVEWQPGSPIPASTDR